MEEGEEEGERGSALRRWEWDFADAWSDRETCVGKQHQDVLTGYGRAPKLTGIARAFSRHEYDPFMEKKGYYPLPELLEKAIKLEAVQMFGPDRSKITPYPHAFKASRHFPLPFPVPNSARPSGSH